MADSREGAVREKPTREFVQDANGEWYVLFGTSTFAELRYVGPKKPRDA